MVTLNKKELKKMKANQDNGGSENKGRRQTFGTVCLATCKEALAHIRDIKEAIFAEARETLQVQEHLLRLALNEAEAVASQTSYPHLVFPGLAMEKVQRTADWNRRQRLLA
jgi:hypothetical protein